MTEVLTLDAVEITPDIIREQVKDLVATNISQINAVVTAKQADVESFIVALPLPAIKDQGTYDIVVDSAKKAKGLADDLEELRVSFTKPINDGLKEINDLFKPPQAQLKTVIDGAKRNTLAWQQEQENIKIEEQRKADEIARKERERIEAEARKKRDAEIEQRRIAEDAEQRAKDAKTTEERKKAQAEAAKAREKEAAAAAAAETKEAIAEKVIAPVVQVGTVNKGGVSQSAKFTVQVIDKKAFIESVLKSGQLEYVLIDDKLLTKEAQATKGARSWPGIKVIKSFTGSLRA